MAHRPPITLNIVRNHRDTLPILRSMLQNLPTPIRAHRCTCQRQDRHRHNVLLTTQANMLSLRHHDHPPTNSHPNTLLVPWALPTSLMATSHTRSVTLHQHSHQPPTLGRYISLHCPTLRLPRYQRRGNQRTLDMVVRSGHMVIPSSANLRCTILLGHSPM